MFHFSCCLQRVAPAIQSLYSTCTAARKEQYEAFMQIKWNGNITDLFTALSGIVAQFAD